MNVTTKTTTKTTTTKTQRLVEALQNGEELTAKQIKARFGEG